jgi:dihydroflavonol-4-reductase
LGSWVTKRLVADGHQVSILRRPKSDLSAILNLDVEHRLGDVVEMESLERALSGVDTVFHLAGYIGYSRARRPQMEKVNVMGTKNVVDACLKNKVKRLVHLSSVVAIGASFDGKTPLDETAIYNLSHLDLGYFETKRKGEAIAFGLGKEERRGPDIF